MKLLPLPVVCGLFILAPNLPSTAKETWWFGETEHFEISSSASVKRTQYIVEELQLVRAVFQQLNPRFVGQTSRRLRVVICRDGKTMDLVSPLYQGKPKDLGGMFSNDFEGGFILINAEGDFESSKHIVYHEYVHFLSNNRKLHLPRWLGEGVAEVYSTIEPKGRNQVILGKPPLGRVERLRESPLIPLKRLFSVGSESPEYNSSDHGRGVFYAQSWALVHYLLFGKTGFPEGSYQALVKLVLNDFHVTEEKFIEIFGVGFEGMEKQLNRYIRSGGYTMKKIDKPEIEETSGLELRRGVEGEELLPIGMIRLSTRGPSEAAGYLMAAYNSLPDSPVAAAYYGYLDYRNDRYEDAAKYLFQAVERGSNSPATQMYAAIARMRVLNPKGSVTQRSYDLKTTVELLKLLFKARELGENRPQLYHYMGRAWLNSTVDPKEENLGVLFEGARLYRDDAQIGFYLVLLIHRLGKTEEARTLMNHYKMMELSGSDRKNFEWLQGYLDRP